MMQQTECPVVPVIPLEVLEGLAPEVAVQMLQRREDLVREIVEDPFYHAYQPERWRLIDLAVARKRLEKPGKVIELIVMGGHDGGKTFGCVLRTLRHFLHTPKAACWALQSTETNSQEVHQQRMYEVFPRSVRASLNDRGGARNRRDVSLKFGDGKGFTNNRFTYNWDVDLPGRRGTAPEGRTKCGGVMSFKFYESKVKNVQGAKLTCANSDELVDEGMATTVRQRMIPRATITAAGWFLQEIEVIVKVLEAGQQLSAYQMGLLYTSVHLVGFTPIDGYSPFVAGALDGAVTLQDEEASVVVAEEMVIPKCFPCVPAGPGEKRVLLLPIYGVGGKVTGCKRVPVLRQGSKSTVLIAQLPTHSNPYTNVDGKIGELEGATEEYVRMSYFGDVSKNWQTKFPKFRPALMPLGQVFDSPDLPRDGTWYHFADFATGRNFFMIWLMMDPQDRMWVVREWPQEGDYIPEDDWGDPGAWAITSKTGKRDGDMGPAAPDRGMGLAAYKREMERIEAEIGKWWSDGGGSIIIEQRQGDSRLGNNPTKTSEGNTTIIEEFTGEDVWFDPMSGKSLDEGDAMINNALSWDMTKPYGARNSAKLFIHKQCKALIFALSNYSGTDGAKAACKDPRDVLAGALLAKLRYLGGDTLAVRVGRGLKKN